MTDGIVRPNTFIFDVKPAKRYRMIFSIWGHINSDSITDFDDINELEEEKKLIKEYYNSTPRPEKVYKGEKTYRYDKRKYEISYENGGCYWGYITLDYQDKKILEIYNKFSRSLIMDCQCLHMHACTLTESHYIILGEGTDHE